MGIKGGGEKGRRSRILALLILSLLLFNTLIFSFYFINSSFSEIKSDNLSLKKAFYDGKVYVIDDYENNSIADSYFSASYKNNSLKYEAGESSGSVCGNRIVEIGEECDDGDDGNDCCNNKCKNMCEDGGGSGGGSGGGDNNEDGNEDDCDTGIGSPDKECKCFGFDFGVSKWECDGKWTEREAIHSGTSVTGNCNSANWDVKNSSADGIVVKAGNIEHGGYHYAINGTNGTLNLSKDLSHITFCGYNVTEYCGDEIINGNEECDLGSDNGKECTPPYNGSCAYCSAACQSITLIGGFCGDNVINGNEECEPPDTETCDENCRLKKECYDDNDCPDDTNSTNYCFDNDVYYNFIDYFCLSSSCDFEINKILKQDCGEDEYEEEYHCYNDDVWKNISIISRGCENGECFINNNFQTEKQEDCGEDYCNVWSEYYCVGKNKTRERTCYEKGCDDGSCFNNSYTEKQSDECLYGCMDGNCIEQVCEHDVGIRYSYSNSFGTGIAIKLNGTNDWIDEPVELIQNRNYIVKYYIDNKIENSTNNIHVVVKINDIILAEYDKTIDEYHYKEINLDTSGLTRSYNLSVYVEKINETDCNLSDNYAERKITIETEFICNKDSDCGEDGWLHNDFCKCSSYVWDFWINYTCVNPGTPESYCTNSTNMELKQKCGNDYCTGWKNYCKNDDVWKNQSCYDVGCALGACFNFTSMNETFVQDCGEDSCNEPILYCKDNNVWKNQTCYDKGCQFGGCFNNPFTNKSKVEDCGESSYGEWNYYCIGKEVWRNKTDYEKGCKNAECYSKKDYKNEYVKECEYRCVNGECEKPECGDGNLDAGEECDDGNNVNGDGCSADCEIEGCPDKDFDCVCDQNDWCLNSRLGEPVDEHGCDQFQFCGKLSCGEGCYKLDFIPKYEYPNCNESINSSPEGQYPGDCTFVMISKEGQLQPRCFPTTCAD